MKIFISYRREDAGGYTKLLADKLQARYGQEEFFFDRHTIRPGEDFASRIEGTLVSCKGVLAAIGKDWLTVTEKGTNQRRIDNPQDWVRREIATALQRKIPLIPVLLPGAEMPGAAQLPDELKDLANKNATFLHAENFDEEIKSLYGYLETEFGLKPRGKPKSYALWVTAAAAGITGVVILGALMIPQPEPYKIQVNVVGPSAADLAGLGEDCGAIIENDLKVWAKDLPAPPAAKVGQREWEITIEDSRDLPKSLPVEILAAAGDGKCSFIGQSSSSLTLDSSKFLVANVHLRKIEK